MGLGSGEASSLRSGCMAIPTTGSEKTILVFRKIEPVGGFDGSAIRGHRSRH